jgi:hypothetical protein
MVCSPSITTTPYRYERSIPCKKNIKNLLHLAQNLPCDICAKVIEFVGKKISSPEFIARNRKTEKAFTRQRKLPFRVLQSACRLED